jgi:hypothetical protein
MRKGGGAQPRVRALYYFGELIDSFFLTIRNKKFTPKRRFSRCDEKRTNTFRPEAGNSEALFGR